MTITAWDRRVRVPQGSEDGASCPKQLPGAAAKSQPAEVGVSCVSETAKSSHTQPLDIASSRNPKGPIGTRTPEKHTRLHPREKHMRGPAHTPQRCFRFEISVLSSGSWVAVGRQRFQMSKE